jgi:hypothetical protein
MAWAWVTGQLGDDLKRAGVAPPRTEIQRQR